MKKEEQHTSTYRIEGHGGISAITEAYFEILHKSLNAQSEKEVTRHLSRNKLLVRERIKALFDIDSDFIELSALAAYGQYNNRFPAAGIVTGLGKIHGQWTVVIANDATVKGGTYVKETIKKHLRAQQIAEENNLPVVYLVDSGGVFLPDQAEVFPDVDDFGRIFYNQARLSAKGIMQVAVVMGSCTAGGAYIPAMSDETIIVRNQGTIFLGGPPLVKAATGETVTAEELGGAEVHTSKSGVADHIAENDNHALQICRDIFATLPAKALPVKQKYAEPKKNISELLQLIPESVKHVFDPREIIERITDDSQFHEFKANYGTTLVTGFARVKGCPVGIIANQGILFSESALKGTHFIELCAYRKVPILFLQNIAGFIIGKQYEHQGIARDGAKMVHAVANANVPKITIITGGSFGAGNYAMAGRAYNPRFLFMYPNAKISVMGGEQAANVLLTVKKEQYQRNGEQLPANEADAIYQQITEKYNHEGSAYYSTSRLWDDGIISPLDTREVVARCLEIVGNAPINDPAFGVYRM